MSDEQELPHSVGSGSVSIMGVELVFHMLSDGSRIIEADSMHAFIEALAGGATLSEADAAELAKAVHGRHT